MRVRLAKAWSSLTEVFWVLPAMIIVGCALLALGLLQIDRRGLVPEWLVKSSFVYSGGATGARTLLGAVASSTIGVAGTVFSITIAALSLAAGQMGPRLLRSFTRDRGNQATLGIFLGTFTYALFVLRTVRDDGGNTFVPHLALSVGMALAFVSVGMLVYFVEHIAGRINVDTVIEIVFEDVERTMQKLTTDAPSPRLAFGYDFAGGKVISEQRYGFLQHLDEAGLADWAAGNATVIHLLVRPGDYIFPGAPIAVVKPPVHGSEEAVKEATALGSQRISAQDLVYAIRQLEEVAVRALSPGINDPHTAMSVLVRFGTVLCGLSGRHLPGGVVLRDKRPVIIMSAVTYDGLTDAMFHMIRQNAAGSIAVLCAGLDVMIATASVDRDAKRLATLQRHADLWLADAKRDIANPSDLRDVEHRHAAFALMRADGPLPREWRDI